ncbi:MAG: GC-type dockerin domain-anchored protein [Phycisphaerales bacterium]
MSLTTHRTLAAAIAVATFAVVTQAQVTVRGVPTLRWATSDGSIGFQNATVEDFEDTTLAPGLSIFWSASGGTVGPVTTLPRVFNPNTDDPFGTAFNNGQWDGTHALISAPGNQSYSYSAAQNWGDVELRFDPPVTAVGFSMQQADAEVTLVVNGTPAGGLSALSGLSFNGGRTGYIVVTASGGGTISTLKLDNSGGDGFVIDHLLYTTQTAPVVSVTGFNATVWPRKDGEVGITPVQTEDFEDVNLVPGLQVGWESMAGATPLSSTLPQTFDPLTQDPFGNVFESSVWDGTRSVINTRDNASHQYVGTFEWGDIVFAFNPPRQSVGFSIEQAEGEARLVVNGRDVGGLLNLAGLATAEGRQGYVRIDTPCGGTPISQIRLNNARYFASVADGWGIDHLTFGTPIGFVVPPNGAAICHGTSAAFSVQAGGVGPFSYQWQIETSPDNWTTLGNDPGPLPGGGSAYATPINSPSVHIGLLGRSDLLRVRCVASNSCGSAASSPVHLFTNPADCGAAGGLPGSDGQYDNNDFIAFINYFFAQNPHADMGRAGGLFGDDGRYDNNDFIAFINQFFAGC